MARIVYEGRTKVHFVPTIADTSAPTTAEIAAGTDLTTFVTKDGVQPNATNNRVDTGGIDDRFNPEIMGSWGAAFSLKCMRDDTTDTAYETLVLDLQGYLVVGYNSQGGIVTTDVVEVWPAEFGEPNMDNSAQDTKQTFMAEIAMSEPPDKQAVVAA